MTPFLALPLIQCPLCFAALNGVIVSEVIVYSTVSCSIDCPNRKKKYRLPLTTAPTLELEETTDGGGPA